MTKKTLAIINSKAPYSFNHGKDSLDIALIFGSYEQGISLFFQGDGVFQLTPNQDGEQLSLKDYLKTFSAFEFYDIEDIYVCLESLHERSLTSSFHIENVKVLPAREFAHELKQHKHILRF
ncbi:sulfurtransferase complex subunit TusC [Litorilituus lipolyticus]|uniref:Sulfurtransferase complex subunit TusC n=1 Tax=Litorilituus lipolyticus TaxID=2491017 RepID=A0A502KMW9_9GAMM|nr:sulfurtransferase complex subunit TusC [Litorilituus lipolyticus]TPH12776.1 sulfurtransferase complex subunit TusC [Litorilituus lipolyticus]